MRKIREERGSITLFVLISMLFFLLFLTGVYMVSANRESTVLAETGRIKEIYEQDINQIDDVYETLEDKRKLIADGKFDGAVNTPKLTDNMKAVYWDGDSWERPETQNQWYEYKVQTQTTENGGDSRWANAETSDGSLWVWIPRYSYRITSNEHSNITGTIDIKFSNGTTDDLSGGYKLHPAFEINSTCKGIWVAKFEMSREDLSDGENWSQTTTTGNVATSSIIRMVSKPERSSWRNIQVSNIFTNCLNYNTDLNSHMMRNTEWGAVAYLAHSKYGRNGTEVTINNNSNYMTGYGGDVLSEGGIDNTELPVNKWTGVRGKLASTTGNIYGIYDMSGGSNEYVAGYVNNTNISSNGYIDSLVAGGVKYKDAYAIGITDVQELNYKANADKYGDAVYETSNSHTGSSSWHADYSYFPHAPNFMFVRGGTCIHKGTAAGIFYFYGDDR